MGKASDWLREERRKVLGDWVAFCVDCGAVLRYFEQEQLPGDCPQCAGTLRAHCPSCDARFSSAFAVECEECGAAVRDRTVLGIEIRRG